MGVFFFCITAPVQRSRPTWFLLTRPRFNWLLTSSLKIPFFSSSQIQIHMQRQELQERHAASSHRLLTIRSVHTSRHIPLQLCRRHEIRQNRGRLQFRQKSQVRSKSKAQAQSPRLTEEWKETSSGEEVN